MKGSGGEKMNTAIAVFCAICAGVSIYCAFSLQNSNKKISIEIRQYIEILNDNAKYLQPLVDAAIQQKDEHRLQNILENREE